MSEERLHMRLLRRFGLSTTRLRWRLLKWEQRIRNLRHLGRVPERLRWIRFGHKICRHCGAVNDCEARSCCRCEGGLPSLFLYRLGRVLGFMLPEATPVVVFAFMCGCILLFGIQFGLDGFRALLVPTPRSLDLLGAFAFDPQYPALEWRRLLTFGVVHVGLIHIGFNCYAMSVLGGLAESQLGRKRTFVLITVSQLGAAAATWYWYVQVKGGPVYTAGASGWVSGLLGFAIVHFHAMGRAGEMYRKQLIQWAVYILVFGLVIGANNAGHIGGFLGGAALGFTTTGRASRHERAAWDMAFWVSVALWTLALASQFVYFLQHFGDSMER